ncbi:hypothetical protein ACQP1O_43115 (plasmid) [Nocardia sp. CA-151230]|uniref:hypothetical protein n=1 Tax=Nocardia sp. CA-151230 TaxID=3239982 RepID=UPI003D925A97
MPKAIDVIAERPFECDHCGRTAGDFEGGASSMSRGGDSWRFCHPNVHDRPDCYRLVTVYGEEIGSRKPGGANHDEPDWSRGAAATQGCSGGVHFIGVPGRCQCGMAAGGGGGGGGESSFGTFLTAGGGR